MNENRIYRSRRPLKMVLTVLFALAAALIILAVGIFFGFRRYIVYTSDGVRLDVPWLQEVEEPELPAGTE